MELERIQRNAAQRAHTQHCTEEPDGGLTITTGQVRYELSPEKIKDGLAFAGTWLHLRDKRWFTAEVAADVVNVITARWLGKARGWC